MPAGYPPITGLGEALCEAAAMHERFKRCEASLLLDATGNVIQGWAVTHGRSSIEAVAAAALAFVPEPASGVGLLLISAVGDDDVTFADDATLRRYADLCDTAEAAGAELLDWILTNRETFHSLRTTMSPHLTEPPRLHPGAGWP